MSDTSVDDDVAAVRRITAVPKILEIVTQITGMRFAAVARVTETKWIACAVVDQIEFGLKPGGELVLESTICDEIRQHHKPVIFGHAAADAHWSQHHTAKHYGLESYISIPIFRANREFFGTLCAIDPAPRDLSDRSLLGTLELFAQLIGSQLDSEDQLHRAQNALRDANETAKLREQFVAILGHDLRNPLQAIIIGADVLKNQLTDARSQRMSTLISQSCKRIDSLIENTLDFAHARMGSGIPVRFSRDPGLKQELQQVIDEIAAVYPDRRIDVRISLETVPRVDTKRIGQMLGNLVANAVTHGDADRPVAIEIDSGATQFEMRIRNSGKPIAASTMQELFKPFKRSDDNLTRGLGLGLFIADQIAKAHNGTIQVTSTDDETCFCFRMPLDTAA